MSQPLSIENKEEIAFITSRTAGSKLLLINNKGLEQKILSCLARYQEIYSVVIYGFIIMGNHYHLIAKFPKMNRAIFMRDFNSMTARIISKYANVYGRRSIWGRRYAKQALPRYEDVENWFFYLCLNPISSKLVNNIEDYTSYNSFNDSVNGIEKEYSWLDWTKFMKAKRSNSNISDKHFTSFHKLVFTRLPGYEQMQKHSYINLMGSKLSERSKELVVKFNLVGKRFLGKKNLAKQKLGSIPKNSKISNRYSFRPLVLSLCKKTKSLFLENYFTIYNSYKELSILFRNGNFKIRFPSGTYPPPILFPSSL